MFTIWSMRSLLTHCSHGIAAYVWCIALKLQEDEVFNCELDWKHFELKQKLIIFPPQVHRDMNVVQWKFFTKYERGEKSCRLQKICENNEVEKKS